jgi:RHS repeat-associated protein
LVARRQISGNVLSVYHAGPQAEIRNLTNSSGTVTDTYWFSAYGKTIASSGTTTNPYRYGGKVGYYNDGGSHSYLATRRWYNPEVGRWLSRDPIKYRGGDNQLAYVKGNPMGYVDPDGLAPLDNNGLRPWPVKPEDGSPNGPIFPPYCGPNQTCNVDGPYISPDNPSEAIKVPDNCRAVIWGECGADSPVPSNYLTIFCDSVYGVPTNLLWKIRPKSAPQIIRPTQTNYPDWYWDRNDR